jgi:hypothetical protein
MMIVMDTKAARHGTDAPLTDSRRCFNGATHGISTGGYTKSLCSDHLAATLYVTGGNVRVYPLDAKQRCDYAWQAPDDV